MDGVRPTVMLASGVMSGPDTPSEGAGQHELQLNRIADSNRRSPTSFPRWSCVRLRGFRGKTSSSSEIDWLDGSRTASVLIAA